jgi:hypothetical protein
MKQHLNKIPHLRFIGLLVEALGHFPHAADFKAEP